MLGASADTTYCVCLLPCSEIFAFSPSANALQLRVLFPAAGRQVYASEAYLYCVCEDDGSWVVRRLGRTVRSNVASSLSAGLGWDIASWITRELTPVLSGMCEHNR
jgi:hypothetical protein